MNVKDIIPQMKNEVTVVVRDKDTLEVKRTQTEFNVVTMWAERAKWLTLASIKDGASSTSSWSIYLGDTPIAPYIKTAAENKNSGGLVTSGDIVQDWTWFDGTPDYAETTQRFGAPTSTRTINNISLGRQHTWPNPQWNATFVSLTPPCTQGPTEVLDVTYRMQFYYPTQDPTSLPMAPDVGKILAKSFSLVNSYTLQVDVLAKPYNVLPMWCDVPQNPELMRTTVWYDTGVIHLATNVPDYDNFSFSYNIDQTVSSSVGKIFRSVALGVYNAASTAYGINLGYRAPIWAPITPDEFSFKPIQPIHNHNVNAIEPFLDVDYLATCQGSLTINGDSWTDPDWPEFYRIEYYSTGDVGASTYSVKQRNMVGFAGSSYDPPQDAATHYKAQIPSTPEFTTVYDGHGFIDRHKEICYTTDVTIHWDDEGFTIINNNSGFVRNYDATSPIAFTGTGINQICVIGTDLWIVCSSGGIFRMEDPMGVTPTITQMTNATNSLPSGGDSSCYAVAEGYNTSLWVMCEGALAHSTNPTAATPTFVEYTPLTGTPFDYTGITDNNWSEVEYISVDKNHPDNQMAIAIPNVVNSSHADVIWWSTAGVSSLCGTSNTGAGKYGIVSVSEMGNEWAWINSATSQSLEWGTTNLINIGPNAGYMNVNVCKPLWFYDYYGVPYTFGSVPGGGYGSMGLVRTSDGKWIDTITDSYGDGSRYDGGKTASSIDSRGFIYTGRGFASQEFQPDRVGQLVPFTFNDALNGHHSPFEEIVWKKYHWNGSSWEQNYYAPALDTATHASGPYPGARHNFDTESHTFTGRSLIDVTPVFAAGNFTTQATFAFKLVPGIKPSGANNVISKQEVPQTLFEVSNSTQQFKIMWENSSSNMIIMQDDTTYVISATAAPINTYRLVVAVNGTSVDVYLNGSAVIPTVTIASSVNLANGSGDLVSYIGSNVYDWNQNTITPCPMEFFFGTMENVQMWNVAWNGTDVTNDFANIDGVIGSQPAANMVARYQLTDSLAGLETKTTHASVDVLVEGLTITFSDGTSSPAFVATDYHTFGVVDGILKDNAIAFNHKLSVNAKPIDSNFTEFLNETQTNVVTATTPTVTERAIFTEQYTLETLGAYAYPGQFCDNYANSRTAMAAQQIDTDGYFEGGPQWGNADVIFGLDDSNEIINGVPLVNFGFYFRNNGTVDIYELGSIVASGIETYNVTDVFRVQRVGTTITYHKVVGGTPTLIYTSATASSGTLYSRVNQPVRGHGVRDCSISYTRAAHVMTVGNPITFTGVYNQYYMTLDTSIPDNIQINIGGTPATIHVSNTIFGSMTPPNPGEVTVNVKTGWLVFNAADVGATITGSVVPIYDKV